MEEGGWHFGRNGFQFVMVQMRLLGPRQSLATLKQVEAGEEVLVWQYQKRAYLAGEGVALFVPMEQKANRAKEQEEGGSLSALTMPHAVRMRQEEEPFGTVAGMEQGGRGEEESVLAATVWPLQKGAGGHCCRRERTGGGLTPNTETHGNPKGALKTRPYPYCPKRHKKSAAPAGQQRSLRQPSVR